MFMAVKVRQGETDRPPKADRMMAKKCHRLQTRTQKRPHSCARPHRDVFTWQGVFPYAIVLLCVSTHVRYQLTWSSSMMRRNSDPSLTPSSVCGVCWQEYKHTTMKAVVLHEARDIKTRYRVSRLLLRRLCKRNAETAHV